MNRYLLASSTYRILLCSLFCLAGLIAPSASAAAQGRDIIVLIDTSGSMRLKIGEDKEPKKPELSRINTIKPAFIEMINDIDINATHPENNITLHFYEFCQGAGNQATKYNFGFKGKCLEEKFEIKSEDARKKAIEFVGKLSYHGDKGRPTWLYKSLDQILIVAGDLIKKNPKKPVTLLVISDGADNEPVGDRKLRDMAAVLAKHKDNFREINGKYFVELVTAKGNKEQKKTKNDWIGVTGTDGVIAGEDKKKLLAALRKRVAGIVGPKPHIPKIDIAAAFEVQQNKKAVKNRDVFWIHKKPLEFTLTDTTIVMKMGKEQDAAQKKKILNYAWSYNPKTVNKPDINPGPNEVSLGPGDHSINLKVIEKTKKSNLKMAKTLNFTIKEVEIGATIDGVVKRIRKVPQGELVTFTPVFVGPKDAKKMWDYGDGNKGVENKHIYQVPNEPGMPYKVIYEITLPNEEPIKFKLDGSVQVTKLNAVAKAKPDNPWPGEEVTFTTNAKDVEKVVWNVGGKEMKPNGLNFALTHTFEMPGPVKVVAMIKQKGLEKPLSADASIVVKEVLPIIVVGKKDLFVGEETKYTITQANGQPFPPGFKVEVVLPEDGKEKPAQMIFFTKAGEYKVEVEVTPKGTKKTFRCKVAAILTVKEIKIEIGVKKAKE